ncbi:MAG TPA: flagellar hook-associated protein FlgK [Gemmatimonadales bacterium]|nr:flagellar hook-associated protein FlgK [Gemmatimonadales bacterium]
MSLSSILSIARTALLTHQQAVDTASHNIANASTPGYTRQRLDLRAQDPLRTPQGTIGRGVESDGIRRIRDQFLDQGVHRESAGLGRFDTTRQLLSGLESVLGEPGDNGLSAALDKLFDAFSDLANDPSSVSARALVRENAQALVRQFSGTADRLAEVGRDLLTRMQTGVAQVNSITARIADINSKITAASKGVSAPDLEDQRDLLIDELGKYVDVQVVPHEGGVVGVVAAGALLVDAARASTLEVRSLATGGYGVGIVGNAQPVALGSGELRGLSDFSTTTLPGIQRQLDRFASALVAEVNAIHRAGRTVAGSVNSDFFDPAGLTASSITVAAPIRDSVANIAAGSSGGPGDGSIALRLAQLRTTSAGALQGQTLGEFYTGVVSSVAVLGRAAEQGAATQETLLANVTAQRSSVNGVSIDEEMVSMIKSQQAFAAASRIVNVADEMIRSVLDMV